ncbi:MAG: GFA family protein [Roseinatronobacter sp.]
MNDPLQTRVRNGGCLCGAVRFTLQLASREIGACHCEMCRRWAGSAFLAISVPETQVTWDGAENIARFASSDWAERANCRNCGSPLFYHVTIDAPMRDNLEIAIGALDDPSGLFLAEEIYIDHKPECFSFEGAHPRLTRRETLEKFGISEGESLT